MTGVEASVSVLSNWGLATVGRMTLTTETGLDGDAVLRLRDREWRAGTRASA